MEMKCYVVDAFTDKVFSGNPAAVCLPDKWLPGTLMQEIARENNLSETAFAVKNGDFYDLRWFTPGGEIDLCGHATLATAFVILRFIEPERKAVSFRTKSGLLKVTGRQGVYEMDMPAYSLVRVPVTDDMEQAIGFRPVQAWMGRDLLCVLENEEQVRQAVPVREKVLNLEGLLLHITARGSMFDCVTRSFAPKLNVWEDPVCGSGHCHVIPFWTAELGKKEWHAFQASPRTGILYCRMENDRVFMGGKAALYSIASLFLPDGSVTG